VTCGVCTRRNCVRSQRHTTRFGKGGTEVANCLPLRRLKRWACRIERKAARGAFAGEPPYKRGRTVWGCRCQGSGCTTGMAREVRARLAPRTSRGNGRARHRRPGPQCAKPTPYCDLGKVKFGTIRANPQTQRAERMSQSGRKISSRKGESLF
jgi:hypothetical protein